MLGISHYVLLIQLNTFVLTLFTNLLFSTTAPSESLGCPECRPWWDRRVPGTSPRAVQVPGVQGWEDGEGSRYAAAAGLRRALNARKRLIEADILNEAENILYKM